jgi:hypothetical protein
VTNPKKTQVADKPAQGVLELPQTLASKNCTELSYRFTTPSGKFNVEKFSEDIGDSIISDERHSVILVPSNTANDDYHIHVFWEADDDDPSRTELRVDYHVWPVEIASSKERPVAADNFFEWLGQYFDGVSVNAHIHAELEYPATKWQSRIMLLPMKVPIDDKTAVIDGFSVSFPSPHEGVNQVWIAWNKRTIKLQVYGDRTLYFKGFTPHDDVNAFAAVVKQVIGEKSL